MRPRRRVRLSAEISERLRHLHPDLKRRIWAVLDAVLVGRLTGKLLRDELLGYRSVRVGKFRVVYRVVHEAIDVLTIGPRQTVYEEAERLARKAEAE